VVIGAGPIGCELAQAFGRCSADVTLIGNRGQLLRREEPDAASMLADQLRQERITLLLDSSVTEVGRMRDQLVVHVRQEGGQKATTHGVLADAILVATVREPVMDGLDLETAGVAFDPGKGVVVNDRLQTTNRRIFAAGDIASRYKFTHAADALARIALQNALFHRRLRASALVIPWCTYTDPEIARVGLSAAEAKEQGVAIQTFEQRIDDVDRAILDGETEGFARIHVRAGTDRIVGATIVARHAGEMIGELVLAMTGGLGLKALSATIHPYPTQAAVLKQLGDAYQRTRLTPTVRWLFSKWLEWTR
jgi:pyruvate/2-oxoglutarate dehydrogenase complex dihydrolipoamide dehydrogenase (E3) component